jgi:hypothetical protein
VSHHVTISAGDEAVVVRIVSNTCRRGTHAKMLMHIYPIPYKDVGDLLDPSNSEEMSGTWPGQNASLLVFCGTQAESQMYTIQGCEGQRSLGPCLAQASGMCSLFFVSRQAIDLRPLREGQVRMTLCNVW